MRIPDLYRPLSRMIIGKLLLHRQLTEDQITKDLDCFPESILNTAMKLIKEKGLVVEEGGYLKLNPRICK